MRIKLAGVFCGVVMAIAFVANTMAQDANDSVLDEGVLFFDEFKEKLADGWEWTHPQEGVWELAEEGLKIRSLPGTLWLANNNARNLLLRTAPKAPAYSISVTVTSAPERNGEQAGLLIYVDDDSYIKVVREFFEGEHQLIFAHEVAGEGEGIRYLPNTENPVVLRMTLKEGKITADYRAPNSEEWHELGTCPMLEKPAKVGLFTHGGQRNADRRVQYNRFEIRVVN